MDELRPDWYDMHPDPGAVADMDECPFCGETLGYNKRAHRCPPERDWPR